MFRALPGTSGRGGDRTARTAIHLRDAARSLVAAWSCPLAEHDLLAVLVADGIDLGPDPEDMLTDILDEDAELVMPLADERWAWIPALLDGRIFTHRLSALEAEHDMIGFGPDLAPLSILTESQTY